MRMIFLVLVLRYQRFKPAVHALLCLLCHSNVLFMLSAEVLILHGPTFV